MTQEELKAMVDAEAQLLGIGSSAFMERHREIMELADRIQQHFCGNHSHAFMPFPPYRPYLFALGL